MFGFLRPVRCAGLALHSCDSHASRTMPSMRRSATSKRVAQSAHVRADPLESPAARPSAARCRTSSSKATPHTLAPSPPNATEHGPTRAGTSDTPSPEPGLTHIPRYLTRYHRPIATRTHTHAQWPSRYASTYATILDLGGTRRRLQRAQHTPRQLAALGGEPCRRSAACASLFAKTVAHRMRLSKLIHRSVASQGGSSTGAAVPPHNAAHSHSRCSCRFSAAAAVTPRPCAAAAAGGR